MVKKIEFFAQKQKQHFKIHNLKTQHVYIQNFKIQKTTENAEIPKCQTSILQMFKISAFQISNSSHFQKFNFPFSSNFLIC